MKCSTVVVALAGALTSKVAAYPQLAETLSGLEKRQDPNAWQAPGPGDARTACPGLNTLANHGYINRNGRGVTRQQLQQGFLDAFGFDFAITSAGAQNALNLQGNGQTFDLDTLNQPHQIEHDASLTRDDLQMDFSQNANNHDFNCTVWGMTLDLFGAIDHINYVSSNTARLGRVAQARQQDFPGWFIENAGGSLSEHGFLLAAMNDMSFSQSAGPQARLDWVDYWFTNQRLPTELGWQKNTIGNDYYNSIVSAVSAASTTVPAPRSTGGLCGNLPSSPTGSASSTASSSASSDASTSASITSSSLVSSTPSASASTSASSDISASASITSFGSVSSTPSGSASGSVSTSASSDTSASASITSSSSISSNLWGSNSTSASASITSSPSTSSTGTITSPTSTNSSTFSSPPVYRNSSTIATSPITSPPATITSSSTDKGASVTSSAEAQATSLAGAPPAQPNGYKDVLSTEQWSSVKDSINGYVAHVESIIVALCGLQGIGSGTGWTAPWYGGMGSAPAQPAPPAPQPSVATEVATITITVGAPIATAGGLAPVNTCACK